MRRYGRHVSVLGWLFLGVAVAKLYYLLGGPL
jgi:hypothetical protein